ncbi:MAG: malate synthase A [Alphaproteobacteria bacterium]|nr:malate synthase A [Alphaproteobacteria bacterium]
MKPASVQAAPLKPPPALSVPVVEAVPAAPSQPLKPAKPTATGVKGVVIVGHMRPGFDQILTTEALSFVADLERKFGPRRREILAARAERQKKLDKGEKPDFLPETRRVRESDWTVAPLPPDILDRRVEITGPVDRKMVINALNSGAKVYMADFEDATTPTWANLIEGQLNLRDAVRGSIGFTEPATGKQYKLGPTPAVLFVRPRGWHLPEKHLLVDGQPMSGALLDFGLYLFHNAKALLQRKTGPYFYLPKLESHIEARLWNDIFLHSQEALGIKRGTIKATVLIETILATFEMDEILWELKEHSAGLNCGRWDYIFSYIKKFAEDPACQLPDRALVTMATAMMRNYSLLLIKTCHRRNVHAMGGMAAQIPIKDNPEANAQAMAKVKSDKEREANDGHDGTWVAHPGLVTVAKAEFDKIMTGSNQIGRKRQDVHVTAKDMLTPPSGAMTEASLRLNINVGIGYLEAWLRGFGCVPLYNLMEDAATAEISRAQIWQQVRHKAKLDNGTVVTKEYVRKLVDEAIDRFRQVLGAGYDRRRYAEAADMFVKLVEAPKFPEFLTLPAYDWVVANEGSL